MKAVILIPARPGGLKDGEPLQHKLHVDTGDRLWSGWINRSDVTAASLFDRCISKMGSKYLRLDAQVLALT